MSAMAPETGGLPQWSVQNPRPPETGEGIDVAIYAPQMRVLSISTGVDRLTKQKARHRLEAHLRVWAESSATGTDMVVLLAMADLVDDGTGTVGVGDAGIAARAGVTQLTVTRAAGRLIRAGHVLVDDICGAYRITLLSASQADTLRTPTAVPPLSRRTDAGQPQCHKQCLKHAPSMPEASRT